MTKINVGDRVRAKNPRMIYRVLRIGMKQARIRCDEIGFYDLRYTVPITSLTRVESE